jgi:hypothetical protein
VNPFTVGTKILGGRARRGGRFALYFTVATTGFRLVRRVMSTKQKSLLKFEVKPGEVYEIRGVRRGR